MAAPSNPEEPADILILRLLLYHKKMEKYVKILCRNRARRKFAPGLIEYKLYILLEILRAGLK